MLFLLGKKKAKIGFRIYKLTELLSAQFRHAWPISLPQYYLLRTVTELRLLLSL